jgi:hypothetical protein
MSKIDELYNFIHTNGNDAIVKKFLICRIAPKFAFKPSPISTRVDVVMDKMPNSIVTTVPAVQSPPVSTYVDVAMDKMPASIAATVSAIQLHQYKRCFSSPAQGRPLMNAVKGIREALAAGKITGRFYCPKIYICFADYLISYKTAEDAEDEAKHMQATFSKAIGSGCNIKRITDASDAHDRAVATAFPSLGCV